MIELNNTNNIVSVSLKKISPAVDHINYVEPKDEEDVVFGEVILEMPSFKLKDDFSCSCYLKSTDGYKIQFRSRSGSDPGPSIEVMYTLSRGGKPINRIKNKLKLNDNFYKKVTLSSEKELYDELSKRFGADHIIGFESFAKKMNNPVYEKFDVKWYNRTCFRSLIALYDEYFEYLKNSYDDNGQFFDLSREEIVKKFMSLIYNTATTTPTTFYLIK